MVPKMIRLWCGSVCLIPLVVMLLEGKNNMLVSHSWVMKPYNNPVAMKHAATKHQTQRSVHKMPALADASASKTEEDIVPIILLSGFLGSGKTTTLKHLLENKEGKKLGIIVNDVASVNVDAKLVARQQQEQQQDDDDDDIRTISKSDANIEMIELQNGCACCSIADEFITSINEMLKMKKNSKNEDDKWDAIVVELSGVADPIATKSNWKNAKLNKLEGTDQADITRIVTLVDACTFGTDWMTWDTASDRAGWVDAENDAAVRNVPELLAEQVEAADLLIVNKVDLSGAEQAKLASSVARGINEEAKILQVDFGKVSPQDILFTEAEQEKLEEESHSHSHSHEHSCCGDPDCTDSSHSHEHSHASDCNDSSHSHSHEHTSDSHSHSHEHSDCTDPGCTDTSHSHDHSHESTSSHSHDHSHDSTSIVNLGISNFVYKATRPFDATRLMTLLESWPVPIKETLDLDLINAAQEEGYELDGEDVPASPFVGVLRSKGFCWIGPASWNGPGNDSWRHDTAMYWSHAGKHFGISISGNWWGTISRSKMESIFANNEKEYERIIKEDFVSEEFGDRRQEIVFIGANIDEEVITEELNKCLFTDEEMNHYQQEMGKYEDKKATVSP